MTDRTALISSIVTRAAIAEVRRDLPLPHHPVDKSKGGERAGGRGELSYMLVTMFATIENVHATLRDHRPPDMRPNLPHYYASDLRVPQSYKESMNSEYSEIWKNSVACAGTFEPV